MSRRVERRFVNPEQISRHLFCSICTDVFLDPTRLFCSHTFCKKCITHWNKDHNTCPICRVEIQIELMGKDLIADKMIQDLLVSCPNTGCTWKDVLENLEKHNKTCGFSKSPDWLVRDQNYIKIEEESEDNSTAWTDLKSFPPIAVGFQSPNGHILARGPEDVYCMTYWHAFYAPNPEVTKQFFESVMSHSNRGSRRNSGSGNYAFGLPNNIMIPIYRPVEEMNTDPRDDDIIVVDESTSSSENPSSLGKSQKRKKNSLSINDKVCGNTKSSRKVKSSQLHTIHDDDDGNENYGRSNSRRELGKYISIGEDSSENKLVKKTKAGVV